MAALHDGNGWRLLGAGVHFLEVAPEIYRSRSYAVGDGLIGRYDLARLGILRSGRPDRRVAAVYTVRYGSKSPTRVEPEPHSAIPS